MPAAIERLAAIGYEHQGNLGIEGREAFRSPASTPRHHLYLCPKDSLALRNHVAVRDHLRAHPDVAAHYADLKKSLAKRFPEDVEAYTRGKTEAIRRILKAAGPRVTSLAPQFLVDDLQRSIAYYRRIGFTFGAPWDGFYAIGYADGLELHLKEAPKNQAERRYRRENGHIDAAAGVDGIEAFYERCVANGATIIKPFAATPWGTKDFYLEDPDGYIISFGGRG